MKRKSKIVAICIALAMVFTLAACGDRGGTDDTIQIGVSMGTVQNLFFAQMVQVIEDHAEEIGVEVIVTDEDWDLSSQIASVENFIAMGVAGIILVAFDPEGIASTVQDAVDAGIFVMAYDGIVDTAQGSILLDNYLYGYQVGTMAAEWVNSHPVLRYQEVVEAGVFDFPDIPAIIYRANGIVDAMTNQAPNIQVVAQQMAGVGDEGVVMAENFLQAHPNIQIIAGINDTGALGAYQVFTATGRVGDDFGLFGADGDPQALELIAAGGIYRGTVASAAFDSIREAVDMIVANSRGEEIGDPHMIYDTVPVTPENVHEFLE